jgi:competence protein ComEA
LTRFNTLLAIPLLAAAQPLPSGRGRDTVARVCTRCHATSVFASQQHTRGEWADIVDEMQNAGAKASKAEFRQIVDYLARTFPKR